MQVTKQYKNAVVKVVCKDFNQSGSGFFINNEGVLLTNNHVITKVMPDNTGAINVLYSKAIFVTVDNKTFPASLLISEDADKPIIYDYAVLKINCTNNP
jgi:S1-C subfamily serine protease